MLHLATDLLRLIFATLLISSDHTGPADSRGLTEHFRKWLDTNGYTRWNFPRDDIDGGSFGGRQNDEDVPKNEPVILVHGNGVRALGINAENPGWNATINYLLTHGYKPSEIYATTWGSIVAEHFFNQSHTREHVLKVRKFAEAVMAYTKAKKVDIIAHSMGVTLSRKALKGGKSFDKSEYDVGPPLTNFVDTYVSVAALNLGTVYCATDFAHQVCNSKTGFYPGVLVGTSVVGRSKYLEELLENPGYEGKYRYAIYSLTDEVIGYDNIVYGTPTSRLPGQTGEKVYNSDEYTHRGVRDLTSKVQLAMIRDHMII